ncbi:hypothetical protein BDZ90DRAFT_229892 [Jaminaea rosea]|uniref:RNA helicase n=1 Tax=Jaminaea rosea TaxID=1569628 RepID=A0A316V097_9BASI|nr:hypothetical protein BDZ90DRAFT_229892 [Jaminaea rosea]PWN30902.1 hypothetical protein BDZ90DRAFT_229892 [Jaminaea rosea]
MTDSNKTSPRADSTEDLDARLSFMGSSALGGEDVNDANDRSQDTRRTGTFDSLAPPVAKHDPTRRAPSPRAPSPSVGTIGGHRSPALQASPDKAVPATNDFGGLASTSPRSTLSLGFGFGGDSNDASGAFNHFHAFRSSSPSFASALSHQSNGRRSPWEERPLPGMHQVIDPRPNGGTASPAERPASRLDFSKLQQRSQAAAAAAAAAKASPSHRGPTGLAGPATVNDQPLLVQPRPGFPGRTFSDGSAGAASIASVPTNVDQMTLFSPSAGTGVTSAGMGGVGNMDNHGFPLKTSPEGYPFPATQQPPAVPAYAATSASQSIDRFNHNSSRASHRSVGRPMSPPRHDGQSRFRVSSSGQTPSAMADQEPQRRLASIEAAMDEMTRGLTSVARNVGWLMERERERERQGNASSVGSQLQGAPGNTDDLRALGQQVNVLSNSVQQLMTITTQQQRSGGPGRGGLGGANNSLAGLGLNNGHGNGTTQQQGLAQQAPYIAAPQLSLGSFAGTATTGMSPSGYEGAASPGWNGGGPTGPIDYRGPSPRPGGSNMRPGSRSNWGNEQRGGGGGGDRRWPSNMQQQQQQQQQQQPSHTQQQHALHPSALVRRESMSGVGGSSLDPQAALGGAMAPPEANVVVTKWDHLNLQPDLLRSVLKYGLGPPNKIQQRALPFLLRGSDIIAQAPPTQERIASYVIPSLQTVLNTLRSPPLAASPAAQTAGPFVIMVTTTVDQATQAQRMALGLGGTLGVRVHISAGIGPDPLSDAQAVLQTRPHIIVGTPSRMSELMTCLAKQANLSDVRMVVLDEVDQMIARNLSDHISTLLRVLPSPIGNSPLHSGLPPSSSGPTSPFGSPTAATERQTAIFSNTVPQDVINFAQSIHLRESVRVLVRREGTTVTQHPASNAGGGSGGSRGGDGSHANRSTPSNALGSTQTHTLARQTAPDPTLVALQGLRQYYLYIAVSDTKSASSTSSEMKLDVIADLLEDMEFQQCVLYVGSPGALEAVTYKLATRGIEALALHRDMAQATRQQILANFRSPMSSFGPQRGSQAGSALHRAGAGGKQQRKALISFDTPVLPREVHQVPLLLFYDLPRSVEEYKEKLSCGAGAGSMARPSVCINVVTAATVRGAAGGDVEMLKTLEAHLGCKMAELPLDAKSILNL